MTTEKIAELEAEIAALKAAQSGTVTPPDKKKAHSDGPSVNRRDSAVLYDRLQTENSLRSHGFSMEQIAGGQLKVDYYRHRPRRRVKAGATPEEYPILKGRDGEEDGEVGKIVPNQPGDQDTALKLATRGILPWPPGVDCECKSCRERNGTERSDRQFMAPSAVTTLAAEGHLDFRLDEEDETDNLEPVATTTTVDTLVPEKMVEEAYKPFACPDCDFVPASHLKNQGLSLKIHRSHKHKK